MTFSLFMKYFEVTASEILGVILSVIEIFNCRQKLKVGLIFTDGLKYVLCASSKLLS